MKKINLEKFKLETGSHESFEKGACIMELVSYMADEPWSDHPKCACPILTECAIRLNDRFNDEHRQLMKKFIPLLINTKSTDEIQIARKRLIRWRYITITYPLLLDLWGLKEIAKGLRAFENTLESMALATKYLSDNRSKIYAYSYAYANADADAYANADADAYANADADAYANADAYAYSNANANAYAYAYANADAVKRLREDLVTVSLETLQMAIDVK